MLAHRLRRRANLSPALGQLDVFAGKTFILKHNMTAPDRGQVTVMTWRDQQRVKVTSVIAVISSRHDWPLTWLNSSSRI